MCVLFDFCRVRLFVCLCELSSRVRVYVCLCGLSVQIRQCVFV